MHQLVLMEDELHLVFVLPPLTLLRQGRKGQSAEDLAVRDERYGDVGLRSMNAEAF